jgi:pyridoxal phosphate enzyme (YggS family)
MSEVRENIGRIRERIAAAALRAGRDPKSVRLMAVTKTVSDDRIQAAIEAGIEIIGENYVQEAKRKIELMGKRAEWHLIGHLQTNKAKYAVRLFDMIHSVNRLSLAEELNRRAAAVGTVCRVLIEVNLGGEASKSGAPPE